MSLQGAVEWIQDQVLSISGIGYAPDNMTDLNPTNIWVMVYPVSGEIGTDSANWGRDYDDIAILVYTPRADLGESMYRLEGFPHNIARKIQADLTMGGNVATYENMTYIFFTEQFGGVDCIGYRLLVNRVKTLTTH